MAVQLSLLERSMIVLTLPATTVFLFRRCLNVIVRERLPTSNMLCR